MLTEKEVILQCIKAGLSRRTIRLVLNIRRSEPVRRPDSNGQNVTVRYASHKLGRVIMAESDSCELVAILTMEHNPDVYEYWEQPHRIKLFYKSKSGRNVGPIHTPDFLVISKDFIGFEEWKLEEELQRLHEDSPNRYFKDDNGQWRCPPGEEAAARLGLKYRVRTPATFDPNEVINLKFLDDYKTFDPDTIEGATIDKIEALFLGAPSHRLIDLQAQLHPGELDALYSHIYHRRLYVDLSAAPLTEPERVRVFWNQEQLEAEQCQLESRQMDLFDSARLVRLEEGRRLHWDGQLWAIVNVGDTKVTLLSEDRRYADLPNGTFQLLVEENQIQAAESEALAELDRKVTRILAGANETELSQATKRYRAIQPYLNGQARHGSASLNRTQRRWVSAYRESERMYGNGFIGLIPTISRRGNNQSKIPNRTLELMLDHIDRDYESGKQKNKLSSYQLFVKKCEDTMVVPCSYKAFVRACNNRDAFTQTLKRKGRRGAYRFESTNVTADHHTIQRAFQQAHIDHTQLDIEITATESGEVLGRPWLTLMIDECSRRILGIHLSFDPPSKLACMAVLRDCVRRHHRLPDVIVVDNGKEFHSTYFETMLAFYGVTKKSRPPAKPRFGSKQERVFGTLNTKFLYNLEGNTQITKDVRQVTKANDPKRLACWPFAAFYQRLEQWCFSVYDQSVHSSLGRMPREVFEESQQRHGLRQQRFIAFDETFKILSSPSTSKGKAKVQPNVGVKIHYINYWSEAFRDPRIQGEQVPVRYNPLDASEAYAYVNKRWVHCRSLYTQLFRGCSVRQIELATKTLRERLKRGNKSFNINATTIAEFIESAEAEELLHKQRLHDLEQRHINVEQPDATRNLFEEADLEAIDTCEVDTDAEPIEPELLEDF